MTLEKLLHLSLLHLSLLHHGPHRIITRTNSANICKMHAGARGVESTGTRTLASRSLTLVPGGSANLGCWFVPPIPVPEDPSEDRRDRPLPHLPPRPLSRSRTPPRWGPRHSDRMACRPSCLVPRALALFRPPPGASHAHLGASQWLCPLPGLPFPWPPPLPPLLAPVSFASALLPSPPVPLTPRSSFFPQHRQFSNIRNNLLICC